MTGVNEFQLLTGSVTDPIAFRHLNEVVDLNELLQNAARGSTATTATESRQLLRSLGLGRIAGKTLEVERLQYSDLADLTAPIGKDIPGYSQLTDFMQQRGGITLPPEFISGTAESKGAYAAQLLLEAQQNPYIYVTDQSGATKKLQYKTVLQRMQLDPSNPDSLSHLKFEDISTFGYFSSRDNTGTVMRYRVTDADGDLVYLTQRQIENIRVKTGAGLINESSLLKTVSKTWKTDDATGALKMEEFDPLGSLGSFFQKSDKRLTASTADRKYVDTKAQELIEAVVEKMKTGNPELYSRLAAADALPKTLDDVMLSSNTSTLRLFEAMSLGDDTILGDIAKQAAKAVQDFESANGISVLSDGTVDPTTVKASIRGDYAALVRAQRQSEFNLAQVRQFGQQADQVSRNTLLGNLNYYGMGDSFETLQDIARSYYGEAGQKSSISGLVEYLQKAVDNGVIDGDTQRLFSSILDNWEKAYDGSGVLADYAIKFKAKISLEELKDLNAAIDADDASILTAKYGEDITVEEAKRLRGQLIKELEPFDIKVKTAGARKAQKIDFTKVTSEQIDSILTSSSINELDDVTGRVLLGRQGQIKSVFDLRNLDEMLSRFGVVGYGSEELFKKETLFGRMTLPGESMIRGQAITLDPIGHFGEERVYADVQANIFHSAHMKRKTMIDMMRQNQQMWKEEIQEMLDTGVVPQRLLRKFEQQARLDVNMWEEYGFANRRLAERYRDEAMELMNLIRNGAKPSELPELANRIMKQSHKSVIRETTKAGGRVKVYQPVLPMAQRQAVDTEGVVATRNPLSRENAYGNFGDYVGRGSVTEDDILADLERTGMLDAESITSAKNEGRLIGKNAYKDVDVMLGENDVRAMRLLRYRSDGHKMITPDIAAMGRVGVMYSAGGGFDLDDKFITDLNYITDSSGNRRLATFAFRQPTGPQEYAILMPQLDEKTLMRIMGSDDYMGRSFRGALTDFGKEVDEVYGLNLTNANKSRYATLVKESGMSTEDRVIKYLEALSRNRSDIAQYYYGGGRTGLQQLSEEEIEQGFFRLMDRESEVAKATGRSSRFNIAALDRSTMERTAQLGDTRTIINKAGQAVDQPVYGSTSLQLSVQEIMSDQNLAPSYRNTLMMNIHEASATMESDVVFRERMRNIYRGNQSTFDAMNLPDNVRQQLQNFGTATGGDNAEFMMLRSILEQGPQDLRELVLVEMAEMKVRLAKQATTKATPAALSGYINTLGIARSTDDQFNDILAKISDLPGGDRILAFLNQPYLGYNPEGAIDPSVGGASRQVITQGHMDLMAQFDAFNSIDGVAIDVEESMYKALYQLYKAHGSDQTVFGQNISDLLDPYSEFDDFVTAVKDPSTNLRSLLTGEIEAVRTNILYQEGAKMGRVRALYHAGLIGEDEALRLGLDEFTSSFKMIGEADKVKYLQGVRFGAEEATSIFGLETKDSFFSFMDDLLQDFENVGMSGEKASVQRKMRRQLLEKAFGKNKFGLFLTGEAQKTYGLDDMQKVGEEMIKEAFAMRTKIKQSNAHITRLLHANPETSLDLVAQSSSSKVTRMVTSDMAGQLEQFTKSYQALQAIKQGEASGAINRNVVAYIKDNLGPEFETFADAVGSMGLPNEATKLAFTKQMLEANLSISLEGASQDVYNMIMSQVESIDNPADLRRFMSRLYIDIAEMKTKKDTRQAGTFLENILKPQGDFFEREGRVRLDLAYAQAEREVLRSTADQNLIRSQQQLAKLAEAFDPTGSLGGGGSANNLARVRRSIRSKGVKDLLRGDFLDELAVEENEMFRDMFGGGLRSVDDVMPNIHTADGIPIAQAIEAALGGDLVGDDARVLEDLLSLSAFGQIGEDGNIRYDEQSYENAQRLVRQRKLNQLIAQGNLVEGTDEYTAAERQADDYLNRLGRIADRDAALQIADDADALALFDNYAVDLDSTIPTADSILDDILRDVRPASTTADSVMADVLNPSDIPYKRLSEKFSSVNDLFSMVSRNKGKFAVAAAALAGGAYLYSKHKQNDVSSDTIGGPPLLPGGSAYEMPPTEIIQYPNFTGTSNTGGLGESYELQMAGSQEQVQRFIDSASAIGSGTNASVYSTIRNAGADPYA